MYAYKHIYTQICTVYIYMIKHEKTGLVNGHDVSFKIKISNRRTANASHHFSTSLKTPATAAC